MANPRWQMVQTLVSRYHQGSKEELIRYLPDEEKHSWKKDEDLLSFKEETASAKEIFSSFHPSWLVASLKQAPQNLQKLVLRSLNTELAQDLAHHLNCSVPKEQLSPFASHFVLELFHKRFARMRLIPQNTQPGELAFLIEKKGDFIFKLAFLLGLWDLSEELRRVIDKTRIKQIFKCLQPNEQIFLKSCLHKRDKLFLPAMGLERWTGEPQQLRDLIEKRGFSRLAKALSGHPVETIKNLCRKIDISWADYLVKCLKRRRKAIPKITPVAIQQVNQAMKFLEKKEQLNSEK